MLLFYSVGDICIHILKNDDASVIEFSAFNLTWKSLETALIIYGVMLVHEKAVPLH